MLGVDEDLDGVAVVDLAPNEANSWSDMAKPLNRLQLARLRDEEGEKAKEGERARKSRGEPGLASSRFL